MPLKRSCDRHWQGSSTYGSHDEVVMAMDVVLKKLEDRIEEMVTAFDAAKQREGDLLARVSELEGQIAELEGTHRGGRRRSLPGRRARTTEE